MVLRTPKVSSSRRKGKLGGGREAGEKMWDKNKCQLLKSHMVTWLWQRDFSKKKLLIYPGKIMVPMRHRCWALLRYQTLSEKSDMEEDFALSLFSLPNSNQPFIIHIRPEPPENQTVLCVIINLDSWVESQRDEPYWILTLHFHQPLFLLPGPVLWAQEASADQKSLRPQVSSCVPAIHVHTLGRMSPRTNEKTGSGLNQPTDLASIQSKLFLRNIRIISPRVAMWSACLEL